MKTTKGTSIYCSEVDDMGYAVYDTHVVYIYLLILKLCNVTLYVKSCEVCSQPQTGGLHLLVYV